MRKGYRCECGERHQFGVYVFAHWNDEIVHTCQCGRRHMVQSGEVSLLTRRATKSEIKKLYPK
jgi:hypothetical protein